MTERRTWEEFRAVGLLWWVNRIIHLFGWAIVVVIQSDGAITDVYPARVRYRGFDEASESKGFVSLSGYIAENAADLHSEASQ